MAYDQKDAPLIAAAPDLLRAVCMLLAIIDRNAPKLAGMMEYDFSHAIAAKAKGEIDDDWSQP